MGFALIGFGLLLTIAGARDTQGDLFKLLQGDLTGPDSFLYWIASIAIVGGVGYVPQLRPISHAFLGLIFVVFILNEAKHGHNLFDELNSALKTPSAATVDNSGSGNTPSLSQLQGLGALLGTGN